MSPLSYNDSSSCGIGHSESYESLESIAKPTKTRHSVTFANVHVREYDRTIGDHPDCRVGPPLTIAWDYEEQEVADIDEYESSRITKHNRKIRLTSSERRKILHDEFGISDEEIHDCTQEAQRVKNNRLKTQKEGKRASAKVGNFVDSAKRKLRRTFSKERLANFHYEMASHQNSMFPVFSH